MASTRHPHDKFGEERRNQYIFRTTICFAFCGRIFSWRRSLHARWPRQAWCKLIPRGRRGEWRLGPQPVRLDGLQHRLLEQRARRHVLLPDAREVRHEADHVVRRVRRLGQRCGLGKRPHDDTVQRLSRTSEPLQPGVDHHVRVHRVGGDARAEMVRQEDQPSGLQRLRPGLVAPALSSTIAQLALLERVGLSVGALVVVGLPWRCRDCALPRGAPRGAGLRACTQDLHTARVENNAPLAASSR